MGEMWSITLHFGTQPASESCCHVFTAIPYRTINQNKLLSTLSCCLSRHSIYRSSRNTANRPCSLLWSHFSLPCQEQADKLVSSPSTSLSFSLLILLDMPSSGSLLVSDCMPLLQGTVMVWRKETRETGMAWPGMSMSYTVRKPSCEEILVNSWTSGKQGMALPGTHAPPMSPKWSQLRQPDTLWLSAQHDIQ